jgi:hypothetical protein
MRGRNGVVSYRRLGDLGAGQIAMHFNLKPP